MDVTGKTLDEINEMTKRLNATGGTACGSGLDLIRSRNLSVNGIALCSDGGDNTAPLFHDAYRRYADAFGIEPTVYLFHVPGETDRLSSYCAKARIPVEKFKLGHNVDYYSIPNLALTMRSQLYSLVDEIMETPLLTLNSVIAKAK